MQTYLVEVVHMNINHCKKGFIDTYLVRLVYLFYMYLYISIYLYIRVCINKNYITIKIKKEKLTTLLKKYNCPKNFDLLNIDVEGHEIEVIKGLDFKTYKPKILSDGTIYLKIHPRKWIQIQIRMNETKFNLQFKFLKLPLGSIPSK